MIIILKCLNGMIKTCVENSGLIRLSLFLCIMQLGCIDPVAPEFQFEDDLTIIEGQASSTVGSSFINIQRTSNEFGIYRNIFQEGAIVTFDNLDSGESVTLREQIDTYVTPDDFAVATGETWELNVTLTDGSTYKSLPETVIAPVPFDDISATFEKELFFREDSGKFVPGHSIAVSFNEPVADKNYYLWRFRSFEKLILCKVCDNSIFRNGDCERNPPPPAVLPVGVPRRAPYYTYGCETPCWTIRYNESIEILDDKFTNGTFVEEYPAANIPLYTNENIVVSLEQISLSFDAYQYYRRLQDIIDNNGNFDAPPPAAVIGNVFNVNDDKEMVLGRFTAASNTVKSIFIERTDILDDEVDPPPIFSFETDPPIGNPISFAPCIESRFRTGTEPEGWIGN
ncbi:DUF4249 domain-containing protein [Maribacter sp. ACAM166]|nr:DUF4249 domain-containing protein [Maribacter sp. ACAM166]